MSLELGMMLVFICFVLPSILMVFTFPDKSVSKSDNVDILQDIKSSDQLLQHCIESNSGRKNLRPETIVDLKTAKLILNELCDIYNINRLTKIYIDYDKCKTSNWLAGFVRCGTGKNTETSVFFRDKLQITLKNIFHEFAHYIDYSKNPTCRQTLTNGKCNVKVPNTFAIKHIDMLNKMHDKF
jgi:hypothetical protein